MRNLDGWAQHYANQINAATRSRYGMVKKASVDDEFISAIVSVLRDIDNLRDEDGHPLSPAERDRLFVNIDKYLHTPPGTLGLVKKGSLASDLEFQQQVMNLLRLVS